MAPSPTTTSVPVMNFTQAANMSNHNFHSTLNTARVTDHVTANYATMRDLIAE